MLALARALMVQPKLLLLDEPSLGLAPMIVDTIFEIGIISYGIKDPGVFSDPYASLKIDVKMTTASEGTVIWRDIVEARIAIGTDTEGFLDLAYTVPEYLKEQIAFNQQTISEQKAYTERLKEISQSVVEIERSKAFQESIKPENGVAAEDVTGNTLNHYSLADLIKNSSYFVSYPEPVTVDTSCLEAQVSAYSRGDIGVAPRFGNQGNRVSNLGNLTGFDVWAKRVGAGYTRMNQDILQLGISCQYVQPVEAPTP